MSDRMPLQPPGPSLMGRTPSVVNRACLLSNVSNARPPHVPIPSSPVTPTTLLFRTTYLPSLPSKNLLNTGHTPHHPLASNCISTSLVDARRKKAELFDEEDRSGTKKYRQRVSIDSFALAVQVAVASVPTQLIVVPTNREVSRHQEPSIRASQSPSHLGTTEPSTFSSIESSTSINPFIVDFETPTIGEEYYPPSAF